MEIHPVRTTLLYQQCGTTTGVVLDQWSAEYSTLVTVDTGSVCLYAERFSAVRYFEKTKEDRLDELDGGFPTRKT